MKNIFILPTDKPSKIINSGKQFNLLFNPTIDKRCVNIYITSDEEIKEGDYGLDTFHKEVRKFRNENFKTKYDKKIILTTDQDLIKDGVQAIDDKFLEWFVKNPGCEDVEVESERVFKLDKFNQREFYNKHKIIIPKEEPKQETLEEAAERINSTSSIYDDITNELIMMAKWQAERMYSEEDVLEIINSFEKLCYQYQSNRDWFPSKKSEWFEQFKKK